MINFVSNIKDIWTEFLFAILILLLWQLVVDLDTNIKVVVVAKNVKGQGACFYSS